MLIGVWRCARVRSTAPQTAVDEDLKRTGSALGDTQHLAQKTISAQAQPIPQQGESLSKLSEQFASVQATVEKLQRHVFAEALREDHPAGHRDPRPGARRG